MSRPTWARGLKHFGIKDNEMKMPVAPHVGAWIETPIDVQVLRFLQTSRPTWARGLKPARHPARGDEEGRAPRGRVD